jgi:hypothetical protein
MQDLGQDPHQGRSKVTERQTRTPPESFVLGDQLDWSSDLVPVYLTVELPFWLMMDVGIVWISSDICRFELLITDEDYEIFAHEFRDSRETCGYQGAAPEDFENRPDIRTLPDVTLQRRKQGTVVYFKSRSHKDVLESAATMDGKRKVALSYLESLCEAHIPILNQLVRRYRLLTYDYFAYEVSAWDVPIWHVRVGPSGHLSVPLFTYASLSSRPRIYKQLFDPEVDEEKRKEYTILALTTSADIENIDPSVGVPGEDDLLDARNLMERGDCNGAVRRATTDIEALVEFVLEVELGKHYEAATVTAKLKASKNDFPGRLRQWQKLSGVKLPDGLLNAFESTRQLRHQIVHRGRRITFEERGTAQRHVDTGRWLCNHIERNDARRDLREKNNAVRAIARPTLALRFPVVETKDGFVVQSFRSVI